MKVHTSSLLTSQDIYVSETLPAPGPSDPVHSDPPSGTQTGPLTAGLPVHQPRSPEDDLQAHHPGIEFTSSGVHGNVCESCSCR